MECDQHSDFNPLNLISCHCTDQKRFILSQSTSAQTDVGIICFCVDVIVLDKRKLFASLLKLAKYEFNKNPTSNSNSVH